MRYDGLNQAHGLPLIAAVIRRSIPRIVFPARLPSQTTMKRSGRSAIALCAGYSSGIRTVARRGAFARVDDLDLEGAGVCVSMIHVLFIGLSQVLLA